MGGGGGGAGGRGGVAGGGTRGRARGVRARNQEQAAAGQGDERARPEPHQRRIGMLAKGGPRRIAHDVKLEGHSLLEEVYVIAQQEGRLPVGVLRRLRRVGLRRQGVRIREGACGDPLGGGWRLVHALPREHDGRTDSRVGCDGGGCNRRPGGGPRRRRGTGAPGDDHRTDRLGRDGEGAGGRRRGVQSDVIGQDQRGPVHRRRGERGRREVGHRLGHQGHRVVAHRVLDRVGPRGVRARRRGGRGRGAG